MALLDGNDCQGTYNHSNNIINYSNFRCVMIFGCQLPLMTSRDRKWILEGVKRNESGVAFVELSGKIMPLDWQI